MALIVAIVLAYLKRLGRERDFRSVWAGTLAAVGLAAGAGVIIFVAVGGLEGKAEEIVEGVAAFAAALVLTWMVFWMRRQARTIKSELQHRVDEAVASGSAVALAAIAFFAVLREGLETALFLLGSSVGQQSSLDQAIGGFAGVALAIATGYLIYKGSRRIDLRSFFKATGVLILLFAAGLLAKGLHEFQEVGVFGSVNESVWNVRSIGWLNPSASRFADFLKGLFGWHPAPSLEMVLVYFAYLVPVGFAFLSGTRGMPPVIRPAESREPAPATQ